MLVRLSCFRFLSALRSVRNDNCLILTRRQNHRLLSPILSTIYLTSTILAKSLPQARYEVSTESGPESRVCAKKMDSRLRGNDGHGVVLPFACAGMTGTESSSKFHSLARSEQGHGDSRHAGIRPFLVVRCRWGTYTKHPSSSRCRLLPAISARASVSRPPYESVVMGKAGSNTGKPVPKINRSAPNRSSSSINALCPPR